MKNKFVLILFFSVFLFGIIFWYFFIQNYYYSDKLIDAIRCENIEKVQEIIDKNPDSINTLPSFAPDGWNSIMNLRVQFPLVEACIVDNVEIVKLLIINGADVNGNNGLTALSVTYTGKRNNWYEISQILIENGASLDYRTQYSGNDGSILRDIVQVRPGSNASNYMPENNTEVINAFYYAIINCDHSNINWMEVLQHSVSNDRLEIVRYLLDEGYCNVNDTSIGITAIMFAAMNSNPEMVQLLLDYGADITYMTDDGKTAYDYAVCTNNNEVMSMLQ